MMWKEARSTTLSSNLIRGWRRYMKCIVFRSRLFPIITWLARRASSFLKITNWRWNCRSPFKWHNLRNLKWFRKTSSSRTKNPCPCHQQSRWWRTTNHWDSSLTCLNTTAWERQFALWTLNLTWPLIYFSMGSALKLTHCSRAFDLLNHYERWVLTHLCPRPR